MQRRKSNPLSIGVIGAASVGWTLAVKLAAKGHDVRIANRRGPESLKERAAGAGVPLQPASLDEALNCELVLLAIPWTKVPDLLGHHQAWAGRIIVDATNIFTSYAPDFHIDDLGGDSGSEIVASRAPGARVVKAFNTLPITKMFAPLPAGGLRRVLFVAGDDAAAVQAVSGLVEDVGLTPVVLGSLATAGRQMELRGPLSGLELFSSEREASS